MARSNHQPRRWPVLLASVASLATIAPAAPAAARPRPAAAPAQPTAAEVEGPIPGAPPGDPRSPVLEETYPWFATGVDLAEAGYVEEEFYVSGLADAYSSTGELLATDVPYRSRILVRRPADARRFNGTVLAEWQNVTAGYDLDALWGYRHIMREGYAWVGISAQRVGVNQLVSWSPTRYGSLDVTGGGAFMADELSYDVFAQSAAALRSADSTGPMGGLEANTILAIGASQSAGRMTIYYDSILPQVAPVFDGYGFIVGSAPTRVGTEPVFQVLSETDVRSPNRPPDTDQFRRWEVAGTAHSGWNGQEYRRPLTERDLGTVPVYNCEQPPFSRVPLHHVVGAALNHLVRWVERGKPPPKAPPLEFNADGTKARDDHGLALGGIRLSQVEAPIALNTGDNAGESFCRLFGTHVPFDDATLDRLYPNFGRYLRSVITADIHNILAGYITPADAWENFDEAIHSGVGR